jgi:hypothetical protein
VLINPKYLELKEMDKKEKPEPYPIDIEGNKKAVLNKSPALCKKINSDVFDFNK